MKLPHYLVTEFPAHLYFRIWKKKKNHKLCLSSSLATGAAMDIWPVLPLPDSCLYSDAVHQLTLLSSSCSSIFRKVFSTLLCFWLWPEYFNSCLLCFHYFFFFFPSSNLPAFLTWPWNMLLSVTSTFQRSHLCLIPSLCTIKSINSILQILDLTSHGIK